MTTITTSRPFSLEPLPQKQQVKQGESDSGSALVGARDFVRYHAEDLPPGADISNPTTVYGNALRMTIADNAARVRVAPEAQTLLDDEQRAISSGPSSKPIGLTPVANSCFAAARSAGATSIAIDFKDLDGQVRGADAVSLALFLRRTAQACNLDVSFQNLGDAMTQKVLCLHLEEFLGLNKAA